jgi:hypothetical protein
MALPFFDGIVSPAVALLAGGTNCYTALAYGASEQIELPPYLTVFHDNAWRTINY